MLRIRTLQGSGREGQLYSIKITGKILIVN